MKTHRIMGIVASASLALSAGCQGDAENSTSNNVTATLELLEPTEEDLVTNEIVTDADLADAVNAERAPVSVSWPLAASQAGLDTRPKAHLARSVGYRLEVSAADLRAGVALPVTTPSPVIKLSRAGDTALSADHLVLRDHAGQSHVAGEGILVAASGAELQGAAQFTPGTTLFRVMPELGTGTMTLSVANDAAMAPDDTVVIQVLERDSDTALTVQTSSDTFVRGNSMTVRTSWSNAAGLVPTTAELTGVLRHPNGERIPLTLSPAGNGAFTAQLDSLVTGDTKPGQLWELEIDARGEVDGANVRRTVKTAFADTTPTARLDRMVTVTTGGDMIQMNFTVDVGSPGRYAVTGVVYGTDSAGVVKPFVFAQSADFVEPGSRQISLQFDLTKADTDTFKAPYELRDLRLNDQTRLGLLHRQAQALVVR